jgi:hypothetical protein
MNVAQNSKKFQKLCLQKGNNKAQTPSELCSETMEPSLKNLGENLKCLNFFDFQRQRLRLTVRSKNWISNEDINRQKKTI